MKSRLFASFGAVLLFAFGATSAAGDVGGERTDVGSEVDDAVATAARGSKEPGRVGDMSDEEKERRREVCEREREACDDWCGRTKGGRKCLDECFAKEVECLKKIPSNPIPPTDW